MRDWAASPDFARELFEIVERERPRQIVELGSGVSSLVIAHALKRSGRGHLLSIDHEDRFADITRQRIERFGMSDVVRVIHAPLREQVIEHERWPWYDLDTINLPSEIDLLVVDGPPASLRSQARFPALPVLAQRMSKGALVLMDDAARPDEQAIIARWRALYPGLDVRLLHLEKGAAELRWP